MAFTNKFVLSLKEITKLPEPVLPCDDTSLSANTNDVNASTSSLVSSSIESSSSDCDATSKDPDVDKLRGMWQSRWKQSISKNLPGMFTRVISNGRPQSLLVGVQMGGCQDFTSSASQNLENLQRIYLLEESSSKSKYSPG